MNAAPVGQANPVTSAPDRYFDRTNTDAQTRIILSKSPSNVGLQPRDLHLNRLARRRHREFDASCHQEFSWSSASHAVTGARSDTARLLRALGQSTTHNAGSAGVKTAISTSTFVDKFSPFLRPTRRPSIHTSLAHGDVPNGNAGESDKLTWRSRRRTSAHIRTTSRRLVGPSNPPQSGNDTCTSPRRVPSRRDGGRVSSLREAPEDRGLAEFCCS